jgi:putative phosphonate metabolism protein
MAARYAIYYAPAADSVLWQRASQWLGRDAALSEDRLQPRLAALADLDFAGLTADPRHYGFHATLKAPFALAEGATEAGLITATADFAKACAPFSAEIRPRTLGPFLAFQIEGACPAMSALESDCVRHFEPFRAPLGEADLARRRRAPLTPRQDAQLVDWGYPYVFENFRFHMTLTGAIADTAIRMRVLGVAQSYFAGLPQEHLFDAISVFRQLDRASPFILIGRFGFGGKIAP